MVKKGPGPRYLAQRKQFTKEWIKRMNPELLFPDAVEERLRGCVTLALKQHKFKRERLSEEQLASLQGIARQEHLNYLNLRGDKSLQTAIDYGRFHELILSGLSQYPGAKHYPLSSKQRFALIRAVLSEVKAMHARTVDRKRSRRIA